MAKPLRKVHNAILGAPCLQLSSIILRLAFTTQRNSMDQFENLINTPCWTSPFIDTNTRVFNGRIHHIVYHVQDLRWAYEFGKNHQTLQEVRKWRENGCHPAFQQRWKFPVTLGIIKGFMIIFVQPAIGAIIKCKPRNFLHPQIWIWTTFSHKLQCQISVYWQP
jgi:hypothetical protein